MTSRKSCALDAIIDRPAWGAPMRRAEPRRAWRLEEDWNSVGVG
jgi:hypothetical protein